MSKLQFYLDTGKRKKFELPNKIKNHLDQVQKVTKEIKKITLEKASLDKLARINQEQKALMIFTNEMQILENDMHKCFSWLEKLNTIEDEEKISLKNLQSLVQEYKNIPLKDKDFDHYKKLHDKA